MFYRVKFNNHICAKQVFFCTGAYLFSSSVELEGPYLGGGKDEKTSEGRFIALDLFPRAK